MTTVGYVVIEYNQASKCPSVWSLDCLYDSAEEAAEHMAIGQDETAKVGRGESYAVAKVELLGGST